LTLSIDLETRSRVDLRRAGVYRYAEDSSTGIWCMAYAFDDEEPQIWTPNQPLPRRVCEHVEDGFEIRAWNAQFERVIWWKVISQRMGWICPTDDQYVCTAAEAAAMALPRQLAQAAKVLNVPAQIDAGKHRLIQQMSKPRKPTKKDPREWWDDADKITALHEACKNDVRAEHAIAKRLRPLSEHERAVYLHDQRMNDRGVYLDRPLIQAARKLVTTATDRANKEISHLTNGDVGKVTQVADLTLWLQSTGLAIEDVKKDTLRDLLAGEGEPLSEVQEAVISLRAESAKSSTAKLDAMLACICEDGAARGLHLYHGAATGRWSGKLIQPQNFPRGADPMSGQPTVKDIESYIPLVLTEEYDLIDCEYPVLIVIATMLRSMLTARPGHVLIAADFAQIEARVLAWIAEQNDLVQAFAEGGKIYEPTAARIYDVPVSEITKEDPRRQIGKVTVLAAGFQMGWRTLQAQTKVQTGVDLSDEIAEKAIDAYREINHRIKQFWYEIENTAANAVTNPGEVFSVGRGGAIKYVVRGKFLWCILPSGRPLCYALPRIETRRAPWGKNKDCVTFAGVDGYTKQWKRHAAYGGLWAENVTQAMARDLIAAAMLRTEKAGYANVLSVHDEVVAEVPEGFGSEAEMQQLMERLPRWAEGLPVQAEVWRGSRYRK
jgi:DNA polymerase bacteriophage-type